jgi:hypothetical protein
MQASDDHYPTVKSSMGGLFLQRVSRLTSDFERTRE